MTATKTAKKTAKVARAAAPFGWLSVAQIRILRVLSKLGKNSWLNRHEISERAKEPVTRVIAFTSVAYSTRPHPTLLSRGLVRETETKADGTDRMETVWQITAKGRDAIKQVAR
jgi:hypothetical protein